MQVLYGPFGFPSVVHTPCAIRMPFRALTKGPIQMQVLLVSHKCWAFPTGKPIYQNLPFFAGPFLTVGKDAHKVKTGKEYTHSVLQMQISYSLGI
jgi:hypothetical protein